MADRPICPRCQERGIHPTEQDCINELLAARDQVLAQLAALRREPSIEQTGQYVASYHDY
jgi:hypothetical protein